jgi:transposase
MRDEARWFLQPQGAPQRQYEALRAFFVEGAAASEVADRLGYSLHTVNALVRDFRKDPNVRAFFAARRPGRRALDDAVHQEIVGLRKQNYSIYDIETVLRERDIQLSYGAISRLLRREGFARLPRRLADERPRLEGARPADPPRADIDEQLYRAGTSLRTDAGGVFLFVPLLVDLHFDKVVAKAGYPGSQAIPPRNYVLSALAMKLLGKERWSHVMSVSFDAGLGLFAGLNVLPKTTALTTYSYRASRAMNLRFLSAWMRELRATDLLPGRTFNLDFSPIPHRGRESVLERNYISKRSRAEKSVLTFLAQDGETRAFCYSNATCLKRDRNDEVLAFVEFWKKTYGRKPPHLVFDSRLTTYETLAKLDRQKIRFITLRPRGARLIKELDGLPCRQWKTVRLDAPRREFQRPKVYESTVRLRSGSLQVRQLAVRDLGHEQPILILTNDWTAALHDIIARYAQRMLIENGIAENIGFFHFDALSSAIALNVDFDVTLTLVANSLYKLFVGQLRGYETLSPKRAFRKIVDRRAQVNIRERDIEVIYPSLAYNPVLTAAGFDTTSVPVPWWGGRRLSFRFPSN